MQLAKPRIDIGFATNNPQPVLKFWQDEIGLPFEEVLPIRKGQTQHRYGLAGSVLKINVLEARIPDRPPSGYRGLLIARDGLVAPRALVDPEGNRVTLVPIGTLGITRIGIRLAVRDDGAHGAFYTQALGLTKGARSDNAMSYLAGDTVLLLDAAPDAPDDAGIEGRGYRYVTFQVFAVDREHAHVLRHGGREARAPVTLGTTARISMVRDPDGNFIELSQRASLTGSLEVIS